MLRNIGQSSTKHPSRLTELKTTALLANVKPKPPIKKIKVKTICITQ